MKLYQELRNYIDNQKFKLTYSNDYLNIINYIKIIVLENNLIEVLVPNKLIKIKGKDLKLLRLLNQEILVKGLILNVELVEYYE